MFDVIRQILYLLYYYNKITRKFTMRVYIDDNKVVIITETKTISFNLNKKVDNSLDKC